MTVDKEYKQLPLVAMRGVVILPNESVTFDVGRKVSIKAVDECVEKSCEVILVLQKDPQKVDIDWDDLYDVGLCCTITQALQLSGTDALRITVNKGRRVRITQRHESDPFFVASACEYEDLPFDETYFEAAKRQIMSLVNEMAALSTTRITPEQLLRILPVKTPGMFSDLIASRVFVKPEQRQAVLAEFDQTERIGLVLKLLADEIKVQRIEHRINKLTKEEMDKGQREFYLREKMAVIRKELGDDSAAEIDEFRARAEKKQMPDYAREKLTSAIDHLSALPAASHEAPSLRTLIECMLDLPWSETTEDRIDIKEARKVLDRDHYGLEKVKSRIIEYLAVAKFTGKLSGQIICLVGPPGVGKTSIAASVAEAVGRNFVRMSLGGIDDESEIRGHRRTYIGAMPGRIITAMRQAGSINPLILFDEIDKLNKGIQGDPAAAMLEVLDSAQNTSFRDHFLEVPYDLSQVMFLTTANDRSTIPQPLLDRMEIIEVPGYLDYEKVQIASRHLLPKLLKKHGLTRSQFSVSESMLLQLISGYTRESGVRELERLIGSLCRKAVCELAESESGAKTPTRIVLSGKRLTKYLGAPKYRHEDETATELVGVCNGLAWTSVGGELLTIEAQVLPGTGAMKLTGNLGDVMKESAQAALTYVQAHSGELGLPDDYFRTHDLHVHVPEGAVPKDGPSAGITLMTTITSAVTGMPIDSRLAMTGEITLTGRVLRIGGLREKLLAAVRAGVTHAIVPHENLADVAEIEPEITDPLHIDYATHADDVRRIVFHTKTDELPVYQAYTVPGGVAGIVGS